MSSSAFARAHDQWLEPTEYPPEYDEWLEARDEIKELVQGISDDLETFGYEPVKTLDEIDESIKALENDIRLIKENRDKLAELMDEFPDEYRDECPDDGW